jgi:hypothetical protein
MVARKISVLVLAGFHLLQATWLLQGGIDLLFPRTVVVQAAVGDESCCVGTCGCPADQQKRKSCCCFPADGPRQEPSSEPVRVRLSAFEEAACSGAAAAVASLLQQPAVPAFPPALVPAPAAVAFELPERRPLRPPVDRALDKVPL